VDGEHRAARDARRWRCPARACCSAWGNTKGTAGLELGTSNDELQDRQWRLTEKELKLHQVLSKTVLWQAGNIGVQPFCAPDGAEVRPCGGGQQSIFLPERAEREEERRCCRRMGASREEEMTVWRECCGALKAVTQLGARCNRGRWHAQRGDVTPERRAAATARGSQVGPG
jgi:hypothetical protein